MRGLVAMAADRTVSIGAGDLEGLLAIAGDQAEVHGLTVGDHQGLTVDDLLDGNLVGGDVDLAGSGAGDAESNGVAQELDIALQRVAALGHHELPVVALPLGDVGRIALLEDLQQILIVRAGVGVALIQNHIVRVDADRVAGQRGADQVVGGILVLAHGEVLALLIEGVMADMTINLILKYMGLPTAMDFYESQGWEYR